MIWTYALRITRDISNWELKVKYIHKFCDLWGMLHFGNLEAAHQSHSVSVMHLTALVQVI